MSNNTYQLHVNQGTPMDERKKRPPCFNDRRVWRNTSKTQRSKVRMCKPCAKPCLAVKTCPIHEWGKSRAASGEGDVK